MKPTLRTLALILALSLPAAAQQMVSDRTALTAANLDPAIDILPIVDISAGLSGSKKITIDELFEGWGVTTLGDSLVKATDAATARTALELGTAATAATTAFEAALAPPAANGYILSSTTAGVRSWIAPSAGAGDMLAANNLSDLISAPAARTNLGLGEVNNTSNATERAATATLTNKTLTSPVINVGSDATGDTYYRNAGGLLTRLPIGPNGQFLKVTSGLPSWAAVTGGGDLLAANNLSDLISAATARTNLGLGTAATSASTAFEPALGNPATNGYVLSSTTAGVRSWVPPASAAGYLLASNNLSDLFNFTTARTNLGLGNVDNTSNATERAATATLTNKTLTAPVINLGSDATGDTYYRNAGGLLTRLPAGTNGHVLTLASGIPSWAAAAGGGGGLTNVTESINTASPNATIPVVQLAATNAATNVDFVIAPKGTGALFTRSVNDSKRGNNAVDLSMVRDYYTKVASGTCSVISGGQSNTAHGANSTVCGGNQNTATGNTATVLGGGLNEAVGNYSAAMNYSTYASGVSSLAVGSDTQASGEVSMASGKDATTRGLYAARAHGGGKFASVGDAQAGFYILRRTSTDATAAQLTMDGTERSSTNTIVLPNGSAYAFSGKCVARGGGNQIKSWRFSGTIERESGVATTTLIDSVTLDSDAEAGAVDWVFAVDADTTNGTLRFQGTGATGSTIRWLVTVETCELVY